MHDRILNPFLFYKAAPNDMFSVFMNTSFNAAPLKSTATCVGVDPKNTENAIWSPVAGSDSPLEQASLLCSRKQRFVCKKTSSKHKAVAARKTPVSAQIKDPPLTGDFVFVNNWSSYANKNLNISAASVLLRVNAIDEIIAGVQQDPDSEFDFVLVDHE